MATDYKKFTINEMELLNFKKRRYVRALLANAVASGKVRKLPSCELCRTRCNTQAHHVDYGRPLKVLWLCAKCHGIAHTKGHMLNPANNKQSALPACLDHYKKVSVSFSVPVETFIAIKREADRLQTPISSLMAKEVLGKYQIQSNQLEFELGKNDNA